jgi:hypothetical protein
LKNIAAANSAELSFFLKFLSNISSQICGPTMSPCWTLASLSFGDFVHIQKKPTPRSCSVLCRSQFMCSGGRGIFNGFTKGAFLTICFLGPKSSVSHQSFTMCIFSQLLGSCISAKKITVLSVCCLDSE